MHLVGAGPGDPGLITVAGRDALERADVVVHDRLGTEELLGLCRPDALLLDAGKAPGRAAMSQEEINAALVEHGAAGRRVVRLKGGDPFVFGRGGEEAQALAAAGIRFVVVPGITSAIAAPAYAGVPVTHRGVATSFTVVTGHEDPAKPSEQTDWAALARAPGTIVVLMGMGRLEAIAEALMAGGRAAGEPAAAVQWGTTARQRSVVATLGTIAERAGDQGVGSPAVVVIGPVAALADEIAWRERRPLSGRRVVVTRARAQASELSDRLRELGATVVELPTIRIVRLPDGPGTGDVCARLGAYGLVVLTSVNGVNALFERMADRGLDARALASDATVVAIGPATAERLAARGVRAGVVPERFVAEGVLEALADRPMAGVRALVARARGSRPALVEGLRDRGARVNELELYESVAEDADPGDVESRARRRLPDLHGVLHGARLPRAAQRRGSRAAAVRRGPARGLDRTRHERHRPRGGDRGARGGRRAHHPGPGVGAPGRCGRARGVIVVRPMVALLTDYGPGSEHVGALHAVIAARCPEADRVNLAHDILPGDVRMGALVLARMAPLLPAAIHVAVVDPGVGTSRPMVAVALGEGGFLVGPDNGLLGPAALALAARAAVALEPPPGTPATFHGRDVLAPAAARLAAGTRLSELGPPVDPAALRTLELPASHAAPGRLTAAAVGSDRFGNVQLMAGAADLGAAALAIGDRVEVDAGRGRHFATVARTFADVPPGALLVYLDSHGMVAVAASGGDAAARIGVAPGAQVVVSRSPE